MRKNKTASDNMEYRDMPTGASKVSREVYYRCIWLVKDSKRLKELIRISQKADICENTYRIESDASIINQQVIERAVYDCECIDRALKRVPDVFRKGIVMNITDKQPFSDIAHPNTWKKWKQVFIYELATELHLI